MKIILDVIRVLYLTVSESRLCIKTIGKIVRKQTLMKMICWLIFVIYIQYTLLYDKDML